MNKKEYRDHFLLRCHQVAVAINAVEVESARKAFCDHFAPIHESDDLTDAQVLLMLHDSPNARGLFWYLERDPALQENFGSGRGGFSAKFRVYRSPNGQWMRSAGGKGVACSEAEAVTVSRAVIRSLSAGIKGADAFSLSSFVHGQWKAYQEAINDRTLGDALNLDSPIDESILQLGWAHKYLAINRTDLFSLHHQPLHLAHHLKLLTGEAPPAARYLMDLRWKKFIQNDSELNKFSPTVLMRAAYESLGTPTVEGPQSTRYWRVGTREGAARIDRWPVMRDGNFASIGWGQLGALNERLDGMTKQQAVTHIADALQPKIKNNNRASATHYGQQWFDFYKEMQPGDRIVAMDGQRLLDIGIVEGDYTFDGSDALQPHHRPVDWTGQQSESWKNAPGLRTTVAEFTTNSAAVAFVEQRLAELETMINSDSPESQEPMPPSEKPVLNTILYGPPGTGKTYATSKRAVEIIDGETSYDRAELMARYKALEQTGEIAFVTFHQSYSYEDFIEGIRPEMTDGDDESDENTLEKMGGDAPQRYEIVSGILRRIAARALWAILEPVSLPATAVNSTLSLPSFDTLWRALLNHIEEDPDREYAATADASTARYHMRPTRFQNMEGQNITTGQTHWPYQCGRERARLIYEARRSQDQISPQDVGETLQAGAHKTFTATVLNELKKIEAALPAGIHASDEVRNTTLQLTAGDQAAIVRRFLRSGENSGYRLKKNTTNWSRYVLIIDEINRGNISKILGELITLLEEDKRVGASNERIVTLPYSRHKFALPPNLYLLGTMNTADKSIALVDLALRRRFDFEELRPDFSDTVCTGLTDAMRNVLVELNQRISLRKDRDHRIGHAYFINVTDVASFNRTFERKIIPLLGEYFYGDWEGLRWVLNEKNNTTTGFVRKIPNSEDRAVRNHWQWYVDSDAVEAFDPLATLVRNFNVDPAPVASGE